MQNLKSELSIYLIINGNYLIEARKALNAVEIHWQDVRHRKCWEEWTPHLSKELKRIDMFQEDMFSFKSNITNISGSMRRWCVGECLKGFLVVYFSFLNWSRFNHPMTGILSYTKVTKSVWHLAKSTVFPWPSGNKNLNLKSIHIFEMDNVFHNVN